MRLPFALMGALVISSLMFLFPPVLQYLTYHDPDVKGEKQYQVVSAESLLPQHKKAKPPEQKQKRSQPKPIGDGPKSVARSRFAMDLGVGGGSGGGGVAVGNGSAEAEQMTFAEGETDNDVEPVRQSPPHYPDEARKAGISGLVRAMLTVDENGNVIQVEILEQPGDYGFEKAIRDAVSQWKYKPAEVGGVPVRQKIEQPFKF